MMQKRRLLLLAATLSSYSGLLAQFTYHEGLIADITPQGWLREFLNRQKTGLTGHPDALSYPYNTCLWAGDIPRNGSYGEDWWRYEQTAYYTDGLLRLGYLLDDAELIEKGEEGVKYTLNHPQQSGRLGSSVISSLWPGAVYWRAMKAYFDVHGLSATHRVRLRTSYNTMSNTDLTQGRRHILNIEGMLWLYGQTGTKSLLTKAETAYRTGGFEFDADEAADTAYTYLHGVTYCEMLKVPLLLYAYTGNEDYLSIALNAQDKLERHHMLPDGVPSSAEYTMGRDVDMAHETCDIADYTWSLGYFLAATGEARWADRIERAVFNAAPGAVTPRFDALQYFSSVNQVICTGTSDNNFFKRGSTWMAYRPTHETECCAGNVHRIMPNFASRLWMRGPDDAIVAAMYAPSAIDFTADGVQCRITEETYYPFSGDITFRFSMPRPTRFPFTFRIPGWCRQYRTYICGKQQPTAHPSGTFVTLERDWKDGDEVTLSLTMTPRIVDAADGQGKYVECGPLLMAYPVPANVTEDTRTYSNMNGKVPGDGFKCWSMMPAATWGYAVSTEATTLQLLVDEEKLRNAYPFDPDGTPISVQLPVRPIAWELEQNRYNPILPASEYLRTTGVQRNITLVPYGAAPLRISVMPDALRQPTLTEALLTNPDFELLSEGVINHGGVERKTTKPYGWDVRGNLSGNSYGINHDAANLYGENVCWYNTRPFPLDFQLSQTIPATKLQPGIYRVTCLLWCQTGAYGTCRLFAGNNVQYFGSASDYGKNLTSGEMHTFAGHKGTGGSPFRLEPMEVVAEVKAGESLTVGIRTSRLKPDGTQASGSEATGWFKVDHFRIERIDENATDIIPPQASTHPTSLLENNEHIYGLDGRRLTGMSMLDSRLPKGIYISGHKKWARYR